MLAKGLECPLGTCSTCSTCTAAVETQGGKVHKGQTKLDIECVRALTPLHVQPGGCDSGPVLSLVVTRTMAAMVVVVSGNEDAMGRP